MMDANHFAALLDGKIQEHATMHRDAGDMNGYRAILGVAPAVHEALAAAETALAAERARVAKLVEALTLAANRLQRRAVDNAPGSLLFIETSEWADEARADITEAGQ